MNILIVSANYPPKIGGPAASVPKLALELGKKHNVHVLTCKFPGYAKYEFKINELKNKIDLINGNDTVIGEKAKFKIDIVEFENYDKSYSGKFTILAKEIKDDHFISLINFTKANLKPIISDVKEDPAKFIITSKWITGAPQVTASYSDWNFDTNFSDKEFMFVAPEGASKIEFMTVKTAN